MEITEWAAFTVTEERRLRALSCLPNLRVSVQANESEVRTWQRAPRESLKPPQLPQGIRLKPDRTRSSCLANPVLTSSCCGRIFLEQTFPTGHRACTVIKRRVGAAPNGLLPSTECLLRPVITIVTRLGEEGCEFKASLSHPVSR